MEPLGTITLYYPFLDTEIVDELNDIMTHAANYYDFMKCLGNRALKEESVSDMVYLACAHAWRLHAADILRKISDRFEDSSLVQAWALPLRKQVFEVTRNLIDAAIEEVDKDWMRIELLYLKATYSSHIAEVTEPFEIIDEADALISGNPELDCFSSSINSFKRFYYFVRRMNTESDEAHEMSLQIAKQHDDRYMLFHVISAGRKVKPIERLELIEQAYEIAESFGSPQLMAIALLRIGGVSENTGEYDLAIKCFHDSLETYGYPEMEWFLESMGSPCYRLARIYCELEDGKSALEWSNIALDMAGEGRIERPYLYAQRAEAFILLEEYEDALRDIEFCRKASIRIGRSGNHAMCAIAEGYYELAQGNPDGAIDILERWWNYLGPCIYKNRILIALVKAEMAVCTEDHGTESSGKWMDKLEEYSMENAQHGILMQHAILKGELLLKQNRIDSARQTLLNGLGILDSPAVKTLRDRIQSMLENMTMEH